MMQEISTELVAVLPQPMLNAILASAKNIALLEPSPMEATRRVFGAAINLQFRAMTGFSAAAVGAAILSYRKDKVDMVALEARRVAGQCRPAAGAAPAQNRMHESQHKHDWDMESCQTWGEKEKTWAEGDNDFYKSKWDPGTQSEQWSLTNHPIPHGHFTHQQSESRCPRCEYSM